jgi:hypothetical protein
MPIYGTAASLDLPYELVYENRKVQVPSSWRKSYVNAAGNIFGAISDHEYAPYDLYGYPQEWDAAEAGVLHRTFLVPPEMEGQRIFLRLDGIMQEAAVYLDRERIALWQDGYLPLRIDITDRVKAGGEHRLHVVCASFGKVTLPSGQKKVTGLTGSWFGYIARGIWQDAYLESTPKVALADAFIRTSVRENRLEVDAVVNRTGDAGGATSHPLTVRLAVREWSGGGAGTMAEAPAAITAEAAPGEWSAAYDGVAEQDGSLQTEALFRLDWTDAVLWTPDQPHLYMLELTLSEDGRIVDKLEQRFGFREVWTEGHRFILNGVPVNLRGDSWHFQGAVQQTEDYVRNWYAMCKEVGVNSIRLHAEPYPACYLDIADEMGMLIVDETAIYGSGKTMQADHPDYIANCKKHMERLVRRDKNHPSIIMWSVQNEMRWVDGRDGYKLHIPALMDIIRGLDPTRPIIVEGDNRLLEKKLTEVESRHYNIDGTIAQWDKTVPLVFGEHGGWWYICPQNSSMYVGLAAYRHTDDCAAGLAQKERLFVEHARRQDVSGISTFNFAHYFMRAMPDQDIVLESADLTAPGPKPKVIPAYSLSLNNGLLPKEYPAYRTNPSFAIMAAAFKPVTLIAAEYNRSFFDDADIRRSFDVYNDTLYTRSVRIECRVVQGGQQVHQQTLSFTQAPAERISVSVQWTPLKTADREQAVLTAVLFHDGVRMHELTVSYVIVSQRCKTSRAELALPAAYVGADRDYGLLSALIPDCARLDREDIAGLSGDTLLIIGSKARDNDGCLEDLLKGFVAKGGRLLLLEQESLSLGKLALSRQEFMRAHGGSYTHPVLKGLGDEDFMYWHEEIREEGPLPIIRTAFEKPVAGDFTMLLECSAGDFGDGGDLWSPLLEYRSGQGMFLANQLEVMELVNQVPQACLLLRNMLEYAGSWGTAARSGADEGKLPAGSATVPASTAPAAAWVNKGGNTEQFLDVLRLQYEVLAPGVIPQDTSYSLLLAEASLLQEPGAAEAARRYAAAGGKVVVLPADTSGSSAALFTLLQADVRVTAHETYHLQADYACPEAQGVSPVDLFGFDKVHLSPRDVVNRPLASHRLEGHGCMPVCTSVEGTAWKDYFVGQYSAEYSRLALVEYNKVKAREPGDFVIRALTGDGIILCSQLLLVPDSDKSIRLYTRLLGNLGAGFRDGLLQSVKDDAQCAVEAVMALPCLPHVDFAAMKSYYTDPEFSLNNLGEGLYGWMKKKERSPLDGAFRIGQPEGNPWFLSCFIHVPEDADHPANREAVRGTGREAGPAIRTGKLRVSSAASCEIYMNGEAVPAPEQEILLQTGVNRFIAIVRGGQEDIRISIVFLNPDGTCMNDLRYRMTMDEVEPK